VLVAGYLDFEHARQRRGLFFEAQDVAVIAQVGDEKAGFAQGHIVAGAPHAVDQARRSQAILRDDGGFFGGEVDGNRFYAGFLAQIAFHRRAAVGAGHA